MSNEIILCRTIKHKFTINKELDNENKKRSIKNDKRTDVGISERNRKKKY